MSHTQPLPSPSLTVAASATESARADGSERAPHSRLSRVAPSLVAFALSFGVALTWAAGTPMFGVPDEISHMVRAAGAARGDLAGEPVPGSSARAYDAPVILVPRTTDNRQSGGLCYAFNSTISADCLSLSPDRAVEPQPSTASSYPAPYYIAVGWPSLLSTGLAGLYGMRAASAALFAALVALAVGSLRSRDESASAFLALGVALTPMAWFLAGSVNPSALAIGAGAAAWCGGYAVARGPGPVDRLAWRFGLPLCFLLVARRDSIVWSAIIVATLAVLVARSRLSDLARSRQVRLWAAATVACGLYSLTVGVEAGAGTLGGTAVGSIGRTIGYLGGYVYQMIGILGWLDTNLPAASYLLWLMLFGGLVFGALLLAPRRTVAALALAVVLTEGAILAIGSQRFPYLQGRYVLPAAVGIPLLAGFGLHAATARFRRSALGVGFLAVAAVHVLAYYQQFRRYAISAEPTWWVFGDVRWQPPTAPIPVLLVLNVATLLLMFAWWFRAASATPATESS